MAVGDIAVRVRAGSADASSPKAATVIRRPWDPGHVAVVVCDMWDAHHCVSAAARVREMAPRMNEVVTLLRDQGARIVHAPAGCTDFYRGTPPRERAATVHRVSPPATVGWNDRDPEREPELPGTLGDPGPCSCESPDPCCKAGPPYPWSRQTPEIHIAPDDFVTEDGEELFSILEQEGIDDVVVMGVHTNICVLGRPYGIRQLVYLGRNPILCRDLTDSFHRDPRGHEWGTDRVIAHVERYWCPTVTSAELVGGIPFRPGREGSAVE